MVNRSHDPGFLEIKGSHFEMDTTAQGEFLPQSCKATGQVADHQFSVWQFFSGEFPRSQYQSLCAYT